MQIFSYKYTVSFADIDPKYRMTINAVLCYFQDAIARFLTNGHVGPKDIIKKGLVWVITEFHGHVTGKMPIWPSTIEVEVWISNITDSRTHVDYRMKNESGEEYVSGTSVWAIIDTTARRPVRCMDLENLTSLHDTHDKITHERFRFTSAGKEVSTINHRVTVTDIDFNGHTNNQSYVRIATSMAPLEFSRNHSIKWLHVRFSRESFLNDELCCSLRQVAYNSFTTIVTKNSQADVVCQITSEWTIS